MEKSLFERGDVATISSLVFNRTCHSDTTETGEHSSYTEPLCPEEEVWVVNGFIENSSLWSDFVRTYTAHYSFSNDAMDILIKNISLPHVFAVVEMLINVYGYSEEQLYLLLKQQYSSDEQREQILELLCRKAGIFRQSVYTALEQLDEKYAQLYQSNALKMDDFWTSSRKTKNV